MIPVLAIVAYARAYGFNPDMLKRIVWRCDHVLLAHWKSLDEADKRRRELEAKTKPKVAISQEVAHG